MNNINAVCEHLNNILELLLDYEKETEVMFTCEIDFILNHVEKRQMLSDKITGIYNEAEKLCSEDETGRLKALLANSLDYYEISAEMQGAYQTRQQINAAINRINETEPQIIERIKAEKDKLINQIKDINTGQSAKASKYFDSSKLGENKIFFPKNSVEI